MNRWMVTALALAFASPAQSGVVLFDNFDTANGGVAASNFNGLSSFEVRTSPFGTNVLPDLVVSGACAGGAGGCLDLKNGAYLRSRDAFSFVANDLVTFSVQARNTGSAPNIFEIGFALPVDTPLLDIAYGGAFIDDYGPPVPFDAVTTGLFTGSFTMPDAGFKSYSVSFRAGSAGSVRPVFYSYLFDGGPLIDNASLSIDAAVSAVPEPSAWLMMVAGLFAVGALMRRRGGMRFASVSAFFGKPRL